MKKKTSDIDKKKHTIVENKLEFNSKSYLHNEFITVFEELNLDFESLNKEYDLMRSECLRLLEPLSNFNIDISLVSSCFKKINETLVKYRDLKDRVVNRYYNNIMDAYSFDGKADTDFYLRIMQTLFDSVKSICEHIKAFEDIEEEFKKKYSEFME